MKPSLCPNLFYHSACNDPECNYIHITEPRITQERMLYIRDIFEKNELSDNNDIEVNISSYERDIIEQTSKPLICYQCSKPIFPNNAVCFPCCKIYVCKDCHEKQKWKDECPSCRLIPLNINTVSKDDSSNFNPEFINIFTKYFTCT